MVAFVSTLLVLFGCLAILKPLARRRPVGTPMTWGEAMVAATFVFFLLFWAYGVVPHYWMSWADNELNWRPDVLLADYQWVGGVTLGFFEPQEFGGSFPVTINMLHVRDVITVTIYGVFLAGNIWLWSWWQKRGTQEPSTDVVTSDYGRPLVRKG